MAAKSAELNFKFVPEKLEDITPFWCQKLLINGCTIDKKTTVTNVEVKPITENGSVDGGGLSGSTLFMLIPTYG